MILDAVKARVCGRGAAPDNEPPPEPYSALKAFLADTIVDRRGNSLLLIGSRGSGKRTALRRALAEMADAAGGGEFAQVWLNGFVHVDDRTALRDLVRQLHLEDACESIKAAATFAVNLRQVLDLFRDRVGAAPATHVPEDVPSTRKRRRAPQTPPRAAAPAFAAGRHSLVIVLEEFDLFTAHRNQALLYNLFDIAQTAAFPLAIVGITCCIDAVDQLEKRVKSRFSQRQLFFAGDAAVADAGAAAVARARGILRVAEAPSTKVGGKRRAGESGLAAAAATHEATVAAARAWNRSVDSVLADPAVVALLHSAYDYSRSAATIAQIFLVALAHVEKRGAKTPVLKPSDCLAAADPARPLVFADAKLSLLSGLSMLDLCLVVAMKRYADRNVLAANFEMVYEEYRDFLTRSHAGGWVSRKQGPATLDDRAGASAAPSHILGTMRSFAFKKPVALKAFDGIAQLEIVTPAPGASQNTVREFRLYRLQVLPDYVELVISRDSSLPAVFRRWALGRDS